MLKCIFSILLTLFYFQGHSQETISFPSGITIDPHIENAIKKSKALNIFKIQHFINDVPTTSPLFDLSTLQPLTGIVSINKSDTIITFIGMLIPYGFQIKITKDLCDFEIFVSSRSCKCFKSNLSEKELSYGAGANATSLTLTLSKIHGLLKGDRVYGYLKAESGDIFHFSDAPNQSNFEKWKFSYEGYFYIDFNPINN